MTLTNQNSTVTHNGNGVTTLWPYTFIIPDEASARVGLFDIASGALTELTDTDYSITGIGDDNGGEVTYPLIGSPISAAKRLVIWREVDYTQDTDLTNQTPYYPVVLEAQLDRIVMQVQQLAAETDRSLKVTLGSDLDPDQFIEDLQAAEAAAAASAAAAAASQAAIVIMEDNVEAIQASITLPAVPVALNMLRRNAGNTAYENRTPTQVLADIAAIGHGAAQGLTALQQGQARANIGAGALAGFRNQLINGDFDFWQRGLTVNVASGTAYTADRWVVALTAGISCQAQRQAFSSGDFANYYATFAFSGTGAAGSNVRQRIEDVRTLAGKTVTVSGYISDTVAQSYSIRLFQHFGTGGSPSAGVTTVIGSVAAGTSTVGTYFSLTATLPSTAGKTFGTLDDDYLELQIICSSANAHTLALSHISVVEGDATTEADPFSPRHIQQELALCQRYFFKTYNIDVNPGTVTAAGSLFASTAATQNYNSPGTLQFPVVMRTTPTITLYSTSAGAVGKLTGDGTDYNATTHAIGQRSVGVMANNVSISGPAVFMTVHVTADAEL